MLNVQWVPIGTLKLNPRNARTHNPKQVKQVAGSINAFGWTNPIIVDENSMILAGHGRYLAATRLGQENVPVIVKSGLSDTQKRALAIADNKIASNADWDRTQLAVELGELTTLLPEYNLDLQITGFEAAEIDSLLGDLVDTENEPGDVVPEVEAKAISRTGDLWVLDRHRLLCGDARNRADVSTLMDGAVAAMVFADPPYNVRIGSVQGRGKIKHREFPEASGEKSPAQFTEFLRGWMTLAAQFSEDGSIHFCCMDWRHISETMAAGRDVYHDLKNLVVWTKSNAGQGSFYRSQHELIFVFKNGEGPHQNNIELGKHGRSRSNVWTYAGVNSFRKDRLAELTVHPTVKPVALVADAMRDCSRRGDIVFDPFMGSGTTILAAEKVGRRGYGIEIDPHYVDVAIRRWQDFTRRDAILAATGQTFDEVTAERSTPRKRVRRTR